MTKEILEQMLDDITGEAAGGSFTAEPGDKVAMLIALDGTLLTVERVTSVQVKQTHVVVSCDRDQRYLLELSRVAGIKIQQARGEGAGFT